jgi:hypothetical protein
MSHHTDLGVSTGATGCTAALVSTFLCFFFALPTLKHGTQCLEHMLHAISIQEGPIVSGNGAALKRAETFNPKCWLFVGWGVVGTERCRTGCVTERPV